MLLTNATCSTLLFHLTVYISIKIWHGTRGVDEELAYIFAVLSSLSLRQIKRTRAS